jgi:succinyl-diaminopimelate desuccinylase
VHAVLRPPRLEYDLQLDAGRPALPDTPGAGDAGGRPSPPKPASSTELSTTGGTSDGRFIAQICPQVIEFGPPNASIHKIDEHVVVADIEPLKNIYRRTLENLPAA